MKKFTFPLAGVRDWRRLQLETEEAKLEPLLSERRGILAEGEALEVEAGRAQAECSVTVTERAALATYVQYVAGERKRIAAHLEASGARIRKQQEAIQAARRNLRLIEILEKRRYSEWQAAADREQETLVQEVFAARWVRTRGDSS